MFRNVKFSSLVDSKNSFSTNCATTQFVRDITKTHTVFHYTSAATTFMTIPFVRLLWQCHRCTKRSKVKFFLYTSAPFLLWWQYSISCRCAVPLLPCKIRFELYMESLVCVGCNFASAKMNTAHYFCADNCHYSDGNTNGLTLPWKIYFFSQKLYKKSNDALTTIVFPSHGTVLAFQHGRARACVGG